MPKCPVCGEELVEVGYPKDFFQEYRCPNDCKFEPPLYWRIADAVGVAVTIVLFLIFFPLVAVSYLAEVVKRVGRCKS